MTDSAAPADDVWTVQKILQWTTDFLQQRGIESARLEAELLLAHARNCQRIRLYTEFEVPLTDSERARMREFVKRRASREPLSYITGHREFYGRDFAVGSGVLIPRPETETLIDVCLERIPVDTAARVCEVGFGSGCISVTLAKQRPQLQIVATDISDVALEFAGRNVSAHEVADQVQLLTGFGFEPVRENASGLFDGIVSNPPYVRTDERSSLPPEVVDHEPAEALFSGEDGLDLIRDLIVQAPALLKPGAWIAFEVDSAQCPAVKSLMSEAGFVDIDVVRDLSENERIVVACLPEVRS